MNTPRYSASLSAAESNVLALWTFQLPAHDRMFETWLQDRLDLTFQFGGHKKAYLQIELYSKQDFFKMENSRGASYLILSLSSCCSALVKIFEKSLFSVYLFFGFENIHFVIEVTRKKLHIRLFKKHQPCAFVECKIHLTNQKQAM